jgi:hypothetical protein
VRSLDAICETFAPGAVEQGVPDAVLDAIEQDLTPRERQRLLLLLRTWLPGYSKLSRERREAVLRAWRDSPAPLMRAGFQALRKAALPFAYMLPGRWEEIGYPGPLGPREDAPAPRLEPIQPHGELELECDVCVVGSGAAAALPPACWPPPGPAWWCSRRLASDLGLRPAGRDLGRPRPGGVRRVVLPHRLGRQPDDLDRVHRAHERHGAGR